MPRASNDPPPNVRDRFNHFARRIAESVGSVWAFLLALITVLVWGLTGPLFGFSDTWQLVINTSTTIVTFIMVFLIQSTQNRDAKAMHLKLDELIRAVRGARNDLLDLEELPEKELQALAEQFAALQKRACSAAGQQREGEPCGPAPADYDRGDRRPSSASNGK